MLLFVAGLLSVIFGFWWSEIFAENAGI